MTTTQLTVTQHAVLAHAIHHSDGKLDWFPDNIKGGARKKVLDGLFNRALITTVNVGAGVTKLTTNAFCGCTNLETVNFAENSQLQMLGGSAFKSCTSLKSITLPEGLTAISGNAFKYCRALRNVYLPDTMSVIDNLAFTGLSGITFSVAKDSYAKNWVAAHGFAYVERENG